MTVEQVAPGEAFEQLPFDDGQYKPLAGSEEFIWVSDFRQIAAYSAANRRWVIRRLPAHVGGMLLASIGDRALALMQVCRERCDDEVAVEFRLVSFDGDGRSKERKLPGAASLPDTGGLLRGLYSDGTTAVFAVEHGNEWFVVTLTDESGSSESVTGDYRVLCPDTPGWTGFERVEEGEEGAVRSQVFDDYRVVAGSSLGKLEPVDPPSGARSLMALAGRMTVVCGARGLALVGSGSAWEFAGGQWRSTPSEVVSDGSAPASSYLVDRLPDGTLELLTEGGLIERTSDGVWRRLDGLDRRVRLGNRVLTKELDEQQP